MCIYIYRERERSLRSNNSPLASNHGAKKNHRFLRQRKNPPDSPRPAEMTVLTTRFGNNSVATATWRKPSGRPDIFVYKDWRFGKRSAEGDLLGVFEYRKLLFTFMRGELITPHLPFKDAKIPRKAWRGPVESRLRLFRMIFRCLRSKTINNMSKDVETPCTCDNLLGLYTRSYNWVVWSIPKQREVFWRSNRSEKYSSPFLHKFIDFASETPLEFQLLQALGKT